MELENRNNKINTQTIGKPANCSKLFCLGCGFKFFYLCLAETTQINSTIFGKHVT